MCYIQTTWWFTISYITTTYNYNDHNKKNCIFFKEVMWRFSNNSKGYELILMKYSGNVDSQPRNRWRCFGDVLRFDIGSSEAQTPPKMKFQGVCTQLALVVKQRVTACCVSIRHRRSHLIRLWPLCVRSVFRHSVATTSSRTRTSASVQHRLNAVTGGDWQRTKVIR